MIRQIQPSILTELERERRKLKRVKAYARLAVIAYNLLSGFTFTAIGLCAQGVTPFTTALALASMAVGCAGLGFLLGLEWRL